VREKRFKRPTSDVRLRWDWIHELRQQKKKFWEIAELLTEKEGAYVTGSQVQGWYYQQAGRLGEKTATTRKRRK
jgi:hypothetical protein